MKKQELKEIISESINEVILEQKIHDSDKFLNEEFEKSAIALEEQHESHREVINEGLLTEEQVDEAFFDTVKNLGKNALGSIKNAWQKAKDQGDNDEMARLQQKVAVLKKKNPDAFKKAAKQASAGGAGGGLTRNKNASDTSKSKKPVSPKIKQKVGKAITDKVITDVAKADPKLAEKLKKAKPEQIEKVLKNPKVQSEKARIVDQLKQEPENPKAPGLVGKLWSWAKKNPVKSIAALGLLAIAATVAGPVMVTGAIAGAKMGAGLGALGGGAVDAVKQYKDTGKINLKQLAKASLKGAGAGALGGAIGGAFGALLAKTVSALSPAAQQIVAGQNTQATPQELQQASQALDQTAKQAPIAPQGGHSPLHDEMSRMHDELMAKSKAMQNLGFSKAQIYGLNDGNFKIVGPDGADHFFNKIGKEITDQSLVAKMAGDADSFRKAYNSVPRPESGIVTQRTQSDF